MRTRLTALAIGAAAILAGCQAQNELTFPERVDLICEFQYADFANSLAMSGFVSNAEEDARARQEREEATAEATEKLALLDPPSRSAADFSAYIARRRGQQAAAAAARRAVAAGDVRAFRAADAQLLAYDRRLRRLETRLGLEVCAQDLDEEDEENIRDLLDEAFLEEEPRCRDNFTVRFMREALHITEEEEKDCVGLADDLLPDDIDVTAIRGSVGEIAAAEVRIHGGPADGSLIGVRMLYEREEPVIADMLQISRRPQPAGS